MAWVTASHQEESDFGKEKVIPPLFLIEERTGIRRGRINEHLNLTLISKEEKVIETNSAATPQTEGNGLKPQPTELTKWCHTIV